MPQPRTDKFHGYVNNLAVLDSGKTVKILGGEGLKSVSYTHLTLPTILRV